MCSLLMRLQRSTSLFNFGRFAASWQHAEVNQKAQIAAAKQNVKWALRMKGLPMNRVFRTHSSSWPRAAPSARAGSLAIFAAIRRASSFYDDRCATMPAFEVPFDRHCA